MDDLGSRLRDWFPHLLLGSFPTRVERVHGLAPPDVELWVKHENESSELFGGNKVRKLEFMLGDVRARGMRHVSTFGGTGAHHVAATALHGAAHGFDVEAFLFPQPMDDHVRALLAVERAAGATVHEIRSMLEVIPHRVLPRGAWLAGGGSSAIGTLGWVSGGGEILSQMNRGELPEIDVVYCALGSCGTVAGLWWSLRRETPIEIVAVRVVGRPVGRALAHRLVRGVSRLLSRGPLDLAPRGALPVVRVVHDFIGPGYGSPSTESQATVTRAKEIGLELDPIYTGKVMAALLADAHAGKLANKRVLFLQTQSTAPLDPRRARGLLYPQPCSPNVAPS